MTRPSALRRADAPPPVATTAESSSGASLMWQQLGSEHARELEVFGVEHIKRHQALRYFTWRWRPGALRHSEQLRFLLRHSSPVTLARCAGTPVDLSDASWRGTDWSRRERWAYTVAVRLVWEYARRRDFLGITALDEPLRGDPLPVRWHGRLISQDLANSALETAAIARVLVGRTPSSILEIGAGYGRLAYALLSVFPAASYTIVDIEPALTISRWYLSGLFPDRRLRFLSPEAAPELADASASLALSVSSLQEMTPGQIEDYLRLFDRVAAGGAVYLKQWSEWHNPYDRVTARFDDYPVPSRWEPSFDERAPVQTTFRQAAWSVPR